MLSVAPVSVLLLGVIGMLVVAFSVARMAAEERRYRGPVTVARVPQTGAPQPRSPCTSEHCLAARARSSAGTTSAAPTRGW